MCPKGKDAGLFLSGDTAPALIALNAQIEVMSAGNSSADPCGGSLQRLFSQAVSAFSRGNGEPGSYSENNASERLSFPKIQLARAVWNSPVSLWRCCLK